VTAIDGYVSFDPRNRARRRLQADAFRLPFRDKAFDLVFCWELLHHVSQPQQVLAEMARVARRWAVVCEPNPWNPAQFAFALCDRPHRWVLRFSHRYLQEQAVAAGLDVVHFARCGWIFPNKTPAWMFRVLKHLPYRLPLIGISSCLVARCDASKRSATSFDATHTTRSPGAGGRAA
jgi:SAM-dependent methyltransferase